MFSLQCNLTWRSFNTHLVTWLFVGNSLPCDAGYICTGKSDIPNPTNGIIGYICPIGHFCTSGGVTEQPCDRGTYTPFTGQGECLSCPAGRTCPNMGMNNTIECPVGYYCPNGTYTNGNPCPVGMYNPITGLSNEAACEPCLVGTYCATPGLGAPTANCSAGYLCVSGEQYPSPTGAECPRGHYCLEGNSIIVNF